MGILLTGEGEYHDISIDVHGNDGLYIDISDHTNSETMSIYLGIETAIAFRDRLSKVIEKVQGGSCV